MQENGTEVVPVDTIDHVCDSDKVTFIKMDIEGSELKALQGAADVIRRDKPKLAISIYHRPTDYFEIPFYVKELVPEYRLYIRHHCCPEKFYHKVSCLTEPSSGTSMGTSGLL